MSAEVLYHMPSSTTPNEYTTTPMPYMTQQYALPIHHSSRRDNRGGEHGGLAPPVENSLRRKTPNGTLSAGYEGSVDNWHPQKHQLLPLTDRAAVTEPRPTFYGRHSNTPPHAGNWNAAMSGGFGWSAQSPFPADSMLNQMSFPYLNQQQYYGQTVPSVIQPSFQYLGPTASGGSGPYGPYWHDGTYVPYRPAAVRDPRFYHHGPSVRPVALQQQHGVWQASPAGWPHPPSMPLHYGAAPALPNAHGYGASTYSPFSTGTVSQHPAGLSQYTSQNVSRHAPSVGEEFGATSPHGQQRDKTFAWALQRYRELLSYIHHTRRQQQHSRSSQSQDGTHRPAFYPKPPRPSLSGSSLQLKRHRTRSPVQNPAETNSANSESTYSGPQDQDLKHHRAPGWSPKALHFHDNDYHPRASYEQQQHWPASMQQSFDAYRTLRRSTGMSVSALATPIPVDESPPVQAEAALTEMTRLCQEAEWIWTDGMHLCGCLAYGLSYYQRALKWYNKVLERDPKHLEATSNLAATLLALGRRQEAEQHWAKVIKAAPNHFEAVEHLVGLLCQEQRSRDSIKVIEYVERSLRQPDASAPLKPVDRQSECSSSTASCSPCQLDNDKIVYDFDAEGDAFSTDWRDNPISSEPGFGSSGFAVPGCDNGRILALIHAKGNMLYGLGDNGGAARAFEDAVMIAAGGRFHNIQGLVQHILEVVMSNMGQHPPHPSEKRRLLWNDPILLAPEQALQTAKLCFPHQGELPGLQYVHGGAQSLARRAVISTTSNSLLSLAKIFQDGMANSSRAVGVSPLAHDVRDVLALYYLSLSLQPSPSTANNVGILLASIQSQAAPPSTSRPQHPRLDIPGVVPGSGIALALQYYNYGLQLDANHAHLYTNLGSLLKDIGQLDAAINMYERAVKCDGKFDIALANLANAVKDKGRISDAIIYYKRAVEVSPEFAEAVCGLANALNSVCSWQARGGIADDDGKRDRWHVDPKGMLLDAKQPGASSSGWIKRVVEIVEKQLGEGENWGRGVITPHTIDDLTSQMIAVEGTSNAKEREEGIRKALKRWSGQKWEGPRIARLVERATRRMGWRWYRDLYVDGKKTESHYYRPKLPAGLTVPSAPTVLPFHTFTCPMSAKQIRLISQRNGLRISISTLRSPWLPRQVYPPPRPPAPNLRVGYVSSDFNNHPLAHLMQSVFGMHDTRRVETYCYATTASDNSAHRRQIQSEAPVFYDVSSWSAERLVNQIVKDGIHILVNLNGYTRGARNEVFAARPAPIQMSFMGFAGTLGAEWCDYLLADEMAVPPSTLRPWRRNVDIEDQLVDQNYGGDNDEDWVYGENIIYCRETFFCCDHRQSAPDAQDKRISWEEEQKRRWTMRKELFPQLSDETIIFGNFNQLYKIEPTTFRTWLRILARVPNAILWLLRFPDLGESHLLATARLWAGSDVASRVIFTDVAPKHLHISRARICDVVLDTAECNAHTTAADVLWSGTPLLTLPRYGYKMCSRMAASILKGALPKGEEGEKAATELIAASEDDYEEKAVALGKSLSYSTGCKGAGHGRLMELRKMLFHARWSSALFDTRRWVRDLEDAYDSAWEHWVEGKGGDIWLEQEPRRAAATRKDGE